VSTIAIPICFAPLKTEVGRLEKLTGKAAKPPVAGGGGDKKLTAVEWLAEELKKQSKLNRQLQTSTPQNSLCTKNNYDRSPRRSSGWLS